MFRVFARRFFSDRLRFSLAHEIGHVIMHRVPTDTMEEEANTFAGELLTPAKELYRYFIGRKITLESLARAKAYWRVSMQSLLYQAKEVGVFGHYPADRLRHRISQLGWRTREPADTDFEPEQADLFAALLNLHTTDLECVPTMPWNECPPSRGMSAHLPWNTHMGVCQRLRLLVLETHLCCRACIFNSICWVDDLARLPCPA